MGMMVWGWWCGDGGVWCADGGVGVVVWGWWCGDGGVWCGDGGVRCRCVVWEWWCGDGGVGNLLHEDGSKRRCKQPAIQPERSALTEHRRNRPHSTSLVLLHIPRIVRMQNRLVVCGACAVGGARGEDEQ